MRGIQHFKAADAPGCMTGAQVEALKQALERSSAAPSFFSDLEGCGPVAKLEESFAAVCGTKYALAVSSGTAALHAALLACGVGRGDEVIVTPYSWAQSVAPVIFTGATPVFADINPGTLNIDPDSVKSLIGPKTKAIVPVHLFGHPADMRRLQQIAEKAGIALISDGAHALGSLLDGRPIAGWGDVTCFSLGRGKLVSGGEGGILATDDARLFEKALLMTQHVERVRRFKDLGNMTEPLGLNFRIHPIAALLALCDLRTYHEKLGRRKTVLELFQDGLGEQDLLRTPRLLDGETPAAYGIPLVFSKDQGRKDLVVTLQSEGVPIRTGPVRVPLHMRLRQGPGPVPQFHPSQKKGACPIAETLCEKKELWVLSAVDMDAIDPDEAHCIGQKTYEEAERTEKGRRCREEADF